MADDLVKRVSDELEVRRIMAKLVNIVDGGTPDEFVAYWAEDAVWDGGSAAKSVGVRKGRAGIRQWFIDAHQDFRAGPGSGHRHVAANPVIDVNGDTAVCEWDLVLIRDVGKAPALPGLQGVFRVRDTYRRTPQGWRIARRENPADPPRPDYS